MPFMPTAALTSGVERQAQEFTITTDPDTFVVSQVVDLGGPSAWQVEMTSISIDPDGETFAPAGAPQAGELWADLRSFRMSLDGVTYAIPIPAIFVWQPDLPGDEATTAFGAYGPSPRYLELFEWRIIDSVSFEVYAGANHPTATATFRVEHL